MASPQDYQRRLVKYSNDYDLCGQKNLSYCPIAKIIYSSVVAQTCFVKGTPFNLHCIS